MPWFFVVIELSRILLILALLCTFMSNSITFFVTFLTLWDWETLLRPLKDVVTVDFIVTRRKRFTDQNRTFKASDIFLKIGNSWPRFVYFRLFHIIKINLNWYKHRWCAWDSNPGHQDGKRRRVHWAMAASDIC